MRLLLALMLSGCACNAGISNVIADLAKPDMSAAVDMASVPDMAQPTDMAQSIDLAQPMDLARPVDLAQPRDLRPSPPDLTGHCGSLGEPCCGLTCAVGVCTCNGSLMNCRCK